MKLTTRQLTSLALFIAIAIMLNYFERFIPIVITIPGVRLGLANVVTLVCLGLFGHREAFTVVVMRTLLSAFFYGSLSALFFSLGGGLAALFAMSFLWPHRGKWLSLVGISVVGAVFHNIGQVTVAYLVLNSGAIFGYLPILLTSALITGVLIGVVANRTLDYMQRYNFSRNDEG